MMDVKHGGNMLPRHSHSSSTADGAAAEFSHDDCLSPSSSAYSAAAPSTIGKRLASGKDGQTEGWGGGGMMKAVSTTIESVSMRATKGAPRAAAQTAADARLMAAFERAENEPSRGAFDYSQCVGTFAAEEEKVKLLIEQHAEAEAASASAFSSDRNDEAEDEGRSSDDSNHNKGLQVTRYDEAALAGGSGVNETSTAADEAPLMVDLITDSGMEPLLSSAATSQRSNIVRLVGSEFSADSPTGSSCSTRTGISAASMTPSSSSALVVASSQPLLTAQHHGALPHGRPAAANAPSQSGHNMNGMMSHAAAAQVKQGIAELPAKKERVPGQRTRFEDEDDTADQNMDRRLSSRRGKQGSGRTARSSMSAAGTKGSRKSSLRWDQLLRMYPPPATGRKSADLSAPNVHAYLQKMQRGALIQSFGCLLAVSEHNFGLIAFSENADKMLLSSAQLAAGSITAGSSKNDTPAEGTPAVPIGKLGALPVESVGEGEKQATPLMASGSLKDNAAAPAAAVPAWFASVFQRRRNTAGMNPQRLQRRNSTRGGGGGAAEAADGRQYSGHDASQQQAASAHLEASSPAKGAAWRGFARRTSLQSASTGGGQKGEAKSATKVAQSPALSTAPSSSGRPSSSSQQQKPRGKWTLKSLFKWKPAKDVDAAANVGLELEEEGEFKSLLEFGLDIRSLLTEDSVLLLERACQAEDVTMMNPILVQSLHNSRPFYAILHRVDTGLLLDLEPIGVDDPVLLGPGALNAHKLAGHAINRLQKVPQGNIQHICDVLAKEIRTLSGYDRVMVYRFHPDEHGEVIAEAKSEAAESYLGLHYPATDIPQASRFMLMKNAVRIIADSASHQIRVTHDESLLKEPISLATSTLRAVHGCHKQYLANMGVTASLVLSVMIKSNQPGEKEDPSNPDEWGRKLWGLVVCHHKTARLVPYSVRLACEFLMQVFNLKVQREVELTAEKMEIEMLRTQSLLCNLLLKEAPLGIVSSSPNIKDLIKCDGAALLFGGRVWLLGTTPSEEQLREIAAWLEKEHKNSSGLSTDSLVEAGCPNSSEMSKAVCGMVAARLMEGDFLFWFRSPLEKTVKWSGAKNDPNAVDDPRRMGPRSSFAAFLEVVRNRSAEWEEVEVDAVHSLQSILLTRLTAVSAADVSSSLIKQLDDKRLGIDDDGMSRAEVEISRILDQASAPVLAVDTDGCITGWNSKIAELTGLAVSDALGLSVAKELVRPESIEVVNKALYLAVHGRNTSRLELKFVRWERRRPLRETLILEMNTFARRESSSNDVIGVCLVGQDRTKQRVIEGQFTRLHGDYKAIVKSQNSLIPPIFALDEVGFCTEWNPSMEKSTGVKEDEALGKMVLGTVFGGMLRMKANTLTKLQIVISKGLAGSGVERYPLPFLDRFGTLVESLLTVQPREEADSSGNINGVFCFLQTASPELQSALALQQASEEAAKSNAKSVAYVRHEIRGPMDGLESCMERIGSLKFGNEWLLNAARCQQQMRRASADRDVAAIEEGLAPLRPESSVDVSQLVKVVMTQACGAASGLVKVFLDDKSVSSLDSPIVVITDPIRLQQCLAGFAAAAVGFTPPGGAVTVAVSRRVDEVNGTVNFEFRISHSGDGIPEDVLKSNGAKDVDISIKVPGAILEALGGSFGYKRGSGQNVLLVTIDLPYKRTK